MTRSVSLSLCRRAIFLPGAPGLFERGSQPFGDGRMETAG